MDQFVIATCCNENNMTAKYQLLTKIAYIITYTA